LGVGASFNGGVGTASGSSVVSGVGVTIAGVAGQAIGVSVVLGSSGATAQVVGSASGTCLVVGVVKNVGWSEETLAADIWTEQALPVPLTAENVVSISSAAISSGPISAPSIPQKGDAWSRPVVDIPVWVDANLSGSDWEIKDNTGSIWTRAA
jgi:hypothetical protein